MLILDTNVYLDADRDPAMAAHVAVFLAQQESEVLGVSSIVVSELLIGVQSVAERVRLLAASVGSVDRERVLTPDDTDWRTAGDALNRLGGDDATRGRSFWNDLLIAASCARVRATLVTRNVEDFARIQRVIPVRVQPRPS